MESPVSSGTTGLETPAGIFSVVQKDEDHHSSLFDDASMPFMERITWTGISLHAGVLPGYPASHGCVRMPEQFAEQLYQVSKLGMRVILVRDDIAPAEVAQPAMFTAASQPAGGTSRAASRTLSARSPWRPTQPRGGSRTRSSPRRKRPPRPRRRRRHCGPPRPLSPDAQAEVKATPGMPLKRRTRPSAPRRRRQPRHKPPPVSMPRRPNSMQPSSR